MNYRKLFSALTIGFFCCTTVAAQETEFDLSAQRSELQNILKVPGQKVDHRRLIVNPTPHVMHLTNDGQTDVSLGVELNRKSVHFKNDLEFLSLVPKGIPLNILYGKKYVKQGVKDVNGAYILKIDRGGITIIGRDEQGAFYGIQTLKQLIKSPATIKDKKLPYLYISDYPDLPYRGVVEGFYGTPWSHEVRLSLIDFYGRYKMNTYIYGPKDDIFHSSPNWRLPYPDRERQNIHELVEACKRNRVDFVWAIHPGKDIKWDDEDYHNLVRKFDMMYKEGVRSFAIFFDDISGEGTNPMKQVELLNRLTIEFVKRKGDVSPLIVCPTDYSRLWSNPSPQGALSIYGRSLDPSIKVFWTGDVVCSDITRSTLDWVNSRIRRPAFVWWNYPVTDYVRHIILQGPVYGLETSLTSQEMSGLVSNPMEHGEASKLSLYSVADYTWNPSVYNAIDSWERGLEAITPHAKDAYRTFAIHSSDTESGYRRDESWETDIFRLADYTPKRYQTLMQEFEKIEVVPAEMNRNCENKALLRELNPWLTEFGKLGTRGKKALELMDIFRKGDMKVFWQAYIETLMSDEEKKTYEAHKCGTLKLQPFYEIAMSDMSSMLYRQIAGEDPLTFHAIGSYFNMSIPMGKLMLDRDTVTHYTSGVSQKAGDWIGLDLGKLSPVHEVRILQGRNSVDDTDYYDRAVLEYSSDGKTWQPLIGEISNQYDIHWMGHTISARYIRLRKLASEKNHWVAIRSFEVNPVTVDRLGFELKATDVNQALLAFDHLPATSFVNHDILSFGVMKGIKAYTLLTKLPKGEQMKLRMYDKKNKLIAEKMVESSFHHFNVDQNTARIELEGNAEIFEIIGR